jgi:hypothetical protein
MRRRGVFMAFLLLACNEARADPLNVIVESKTVPAGDGYTLDVTVSGADSLMGVLIDLAYATDRNTLSGVETASGGGSTRFRANPSAYPDSSGSLRTAWVTSEAMSGVDSMLTISFSGRGAAGARDTIRLVVIDAVNEQGTSVDTEGQFGVVIFTNVGDGVHVHLSRATACDPGAVRCPGAESHVAAR